MLAAHAALCTTQRYIEADVSELYALKHSDVGFSEDPKGLLLTIRKGRTGHRVSATMEAAVAIYKRIQMRNPAATHYPIPAGI